MKKPLFVFENIDKVQLNFENKLSRQIKIQEIKKTPN